jgi:hypothetical protein
MAPGLQKSIRDLQRVLRKKSEKGDSVEDLNAKLALLQQEKALSEKKQTEKKHATKYVYSSTVSCCKMHVYTYLSILTLSRILHPHIIGTTW